MTKFVLMVFKTEFKNKPWYASIHESDDTASYGQNSLCSAICETREEAVQEVQRKWLEIRKQIDSLLEAEEKK